MDGYGWLDMEGEHQANHFPPSSTIFHHLPPFSTIFPPTEELG
jgi:hypothetical protein